MACSLPALSTSISRLSLQPVTGRHGQVRQASRQAIKQAGQAGRQALVMSASGDGGGSGDVVVVVC